MKLAVSSLFIAVAALLTSVSSAPVKKGRKSALPLPDAPDEVEIRFKGEKWYDLSLHGEYTWRFTLYPEDKQKFKLVTKDPINAVFGTLIRTAPLLCSNLYTSSDVEFRCSNSAKAPKGYTPHYFHFKCKKGQNQKFSCNPVVI